MMYNSIISPIVPNPTNPVALRCIHLAANVFIMERHRVSPKQFQSFSVYLSVSCSCIATNTTTYLQVGKAAVVVL